MIGIVVALALLAATAFFVLRDVGAPARAEEDRKREIAATVAEPVPPAEPAPPPGTAARTPPPAGQAGPTAAVVPPVAVAPVVAAPAIVVPPPAPAVAKESEEPIAPVATRASSAAEPSEPVDLVEPVDPVETVEEAEKLETAEPVETTEPEAAEAAPVEGPTRAQRRAQRRVQRHAAQRTPKRDALDDGFERRPVYGDAPPLSVVGIGKPHLRPDPERLIQTEVIVRVTIARRLGALIRLAILVALVGGTIAGVLILIGKVIGAALSRAANG